MAAVWHDHHSASIRMLGHAQPLLSDSSVASLAVASISLAAPLPSLRLDKATGAELEQPARPWRKAEGRRGGVNPGRRASVRSGAES